ECAGREAVFGPGFLERCAQSTEIAVDSAWLVRDQAFLTFAGNSLVDELSPSRSGVPKGKDLGVTDRAHRHVEEWRRGEVNHLHGRDRPGYSVGTLASLLKVRDVVLKEHPQRRRRLFGLKGRLALLLEVLQELTLLVLRLVLRRAVDAPAPAVIRDSR